MCSIAISTAQHYSHCAPLLALSGTKVLFPPRSNTCTTYRICTIYYNCTIYHRCTALLRIMIITFCDRSRGRKDNAGPVCPLDGPEPSPALLPCTASTLHRTLFRLRDFLFGHLLLSLGRGHHLQLCIGMLQGCGIPRAPGLCQWQGPLQRLIPVKW